MHIIRRSWTATKIHKQQRPQQQAETQRHKSGNCQGYPGSNIYPGVGGIGKNSQDRENFGNRNGIRMNAKRESHKD